MRTREEIMRHLAELTSGNYSASYISTVQFEILCELLIDIRDAQQLSIPGLIIATEVKGEKHANRKAIPATQSKRPNSAVGGGTKKSSSNRKKASATKRQKGK